MIDIGGLNLNPGKPIKCTICGKTKFDHRANSYHCPTDRKHRTYGHSQFNMDKVFTPPLPKVTP